MTTIVGGSVPNITFSDGTTQNTATSGGGGGASANGAIYINTQTITANYTFTANTSGLSAGPVSLSNAVVTMTAGSRWVIV
jgi:hypothetical protein